MKWIYQLHPAHRSALLGVSNYFRFYSQERTLQSFSSTGDGDAEVIPNFNVQDIQEALGVKIDTLLIDCEGCGHHMMDQLGTIGEEETVSVVWYVTRMIILFF